MLCSFGETSLISTVWDLKNHTFVPFAFFNLLRVGNEDPRTDQNLTDCKDDVKGTLKLSFSV